MCLDGSPFTGDIRRLSTPNRVQMKGAIQPQGLPPTAPAPAARRGQHGAVNGRACDRSRLQRHQWQNPTLTNLFR
jgi:hypothetical protein